MCILSHVTTFPLYRAHHIACNGTYMCAGLALSCVWRADPPPSSCLPSKGPQMRQASVNLYGGYEFDAAPCDICTWPVRIVSNRYALRCEEASDHQCSLALGAARNPRLGEHLVASVRSLAQDFEGFPAGRGRFTAAGWVPLPFCGAVQQQRCRRLSNYRASQRAPAACISLSRSCAQRPLVHAAPGRCSAAGGGRRQREPQRTSTAEAQCLLASCRTKSLTGKAHMDSTFFPGVELLGRGPRAAGENGWWPYPQLVWASCSSIRI
jgi:hypothetical protein